MQHFEGEGQLELLDLSSRSHQANRGAARRYVETFLRYWSIVLIPILVLPLVGYAVAKSNSGGTTAVMNLWVSQDSTKQLGYVDSLTTPANNVAGALGQLLQTESFDVRIARESPAYWRIVAARPDHNMAVVSDLSKNVKILPTGPDLVAITYSSKQPGAGMQLLRSILKEGPRVIAYLNQQQTASSVAHYTRQLKDARARLVQSTRELGTYMQAHNISATQMAAQALFDPGFAALYEAVQSNQANVRNVAQQLSQATPPTVASSTIQAIDPPSEVPTSLSKKTLVLDVVIGLLVGLLLGCGFVVLRTALDRSLRHAEEVPDLVGLPVLASVPYSPSLARERRASGGVSRHGAGRGYAR